MVWSISFGPWPMGNRQYPNKVFLEDCLGFEWKNLSHGNSGMWNKDDVNIVGVKAPVGDEHIKNYRGWGGIDMKYVGHETPQTKGT